LLDSIEKQKEAISILCKNSPNFVAMLKRVVALAYIIIKRNDNPPEMAAMENTNNTTNHKQMK